jgi:hypothetical protein
MDAGSGVDIVSNSEQTARDAVDRLDHGWSLCVLRMILGQSHSETEVTREHHTPRHSDPTPCWRIADLASQRELGLRPQRRARLGPVGLGHPIADWSAVTSPPPIS